MSQHTADEKVADEETIAAALGWERGEQVRQDALSDIDIVRAVTGEAFDDDCADAIARLSRMSWWPRVAKLMEVCSVPRPRLSRREKRWIKRVPSDARPVRPTSETWVGTIMLLDRLTAQVPDMPAPHVSLSGPGGLDVEMVNWNREIMLGFEVVGSTRPVWTWGSFSEDEEAWEGNDVDSAEDIKRALCLMAGD